jgi:hypothetical protein
MKLREKLFALLILISLSLNTLFAQEYSKSKKYVWDNLTVGFSYNTLSAYAAQLIRFGTIIKGYYVNEYGVIIQKDISKRLKLRIGTDITDETFLVGRTVNFSPFVGINYKALQFRKFQMQFYLDFGQTNWHYGLGKNGGYYMFFPTIYYIAPGIVFYYQATSHISFTSEIDLIGYQFSDYKGNPYVKQKWVKDYTFFPHRALSFSINYKFYKK